MNSKIDDKILWHSFRNGDKDAMSQLFRHYYPLLYNYGGKITPDTNLLEDTIQELFTELWQNKSQTEVQSVKAYLITALKYKLFRQLRNKKNHTPDIPEDYNFEISHESLKITAEEDEIKAKRILQSLSKLSNRQKEIIYLKFYQDLSYEEISKIMEINYQAARNLLYQAVKSLKRTFTENFHFLSFLF